MNELKPCPFCGGEAEIVGGPENWTPTFYDPDSGGDPIAVVCKTCACGLHFFDGYAEAASAWNRRTGNDTNVATNADRIRSMSDEELAREMLFFVPSDFNRHYTGIAGGYYATADEAIQANSDWLKQPAREELI